MTDMACKPTARMPHCIVLPDRVCSRVRANVARPGHRLMSLIARFRFTFVAFALGGLLIAAALFSHLDIVRTGLEELEGVGKYVDDLLLTILLIVVGTVVDAVAAQRRAELEARQLETLQATMRT